MSKVIFSNRHSHIFRAMVWSPENWEWSGWVPCRQDVFRDRLRHHHLRRRRCYHHYHPHHHIHCKCIYIWYINISDINLSIFFRYTANSFFHSGRNAAEERFENKSQFLSSPMVTLPFGNLALPMLLCCYVLGEADPPPHKKY